MISRRSFITRAVAAGAASLGAGLLYRDIAASTISGSITLEQRTVSFPNLPESFHGYKIGFLTDIHLGLFLPPSWIEEALTILQEQQPDILVLGGDYILLEDNPLWSLVGLVRNTSYLSMSSKATAAAIYREVSDIVSRYSFRDGTLAVAGNHDHWNYSPLFQQIFSEAPAIQLLINREVSVTKGGDTISFYGADDFLTGTPTDLPPRQSSGPNAAVRVLISHNPDYVSALLRDSAAHFDLALCGHTHGGQIRVPGLGPLAVQIRDPRFSAGLVATGNPSQYVYTSRGLGTVGVPFRVSCPPEVTVLTLSKGRAGST